MFKKLFLLLFVMFMFGSCSEDTPNNPCGGVNCSGHGECIVISGVATCDCDPGYSANGLSCTQNINNCDNVVCDEWENCNLSNGVCELKDNRCYTQENCSENMSCDENHNCINPNNPCDGQNCSNQGVCVIENGSAKCNCNSGFQRDGLSCVDINECLSGNHNCGSGYECQNSVGSFNCVEDIVDLCLNVTCDSWKTCNPQNGVCELNSGHCDNDTNCQSPQVCDLTSHNCVSDLCENVECSGKGSCSVESGVPVCNCIHGYKTSGIECVTDSSIPGWSGIQWPPTLSLDAGDTSIKTHVYGRIYIAGVTETQIQNSNIKGQLGYTTEAIQYPIIASKFQWIDGSFNTSCTGCENNHEYIANFPTDRAGEFKYIYRFSTNGGQSWSYCDLTPNFITSHVINYGVATISDEHLYKPKLTLVSQPTINGNSYSFEVLYTPGVGGENIDWEATDVFLNFEKLANPPYNTTTKKFTISASSVLNGKYTYLFRVKDTSGHTATLFVPIWIESESFEWRDAFLYQIMNDRFLDGDQINNGSANLHSTNNVEWKADWQGGDFRGIIQKIDSNYFSDMGVNAIWISSPIMNTQGAGKGMGSDPHYYAGYHSYWPIATGWTDSVNLNGVQPIEPHFGTEAELKELVKKAHAKKIRILADFVANHVHTDSPLWAQHRYDNWFYMAPQGKPVNSNGGYNCGWEEPIVCWFTDYLPDLNYGNSTVMKEIINHAIWMIQEYDLDGFRLDAVKHMIMEFSTTLRARIQNEVVTTGIPFYMVGETFTGDAEFDTIGMFLGADKLDGQFDFPLFYHLSRVFLLKSQTVIDFKIFVEQNDLRYQNSYYSNALMSNFIGNHDIARAISVANGDFDGSPQGGSVAHDRAWSNEPTIPNLEEPYKRLRMAQTFLLTSTGIPLIYQGDEFGMPGAHDPDNRRMMRFGNELSAFETNTKNHLQKLGVFRKNNPATRKGSRETCEVDNDTWLYKMSFGTNTVMVGFNRNNIEVTKSCSGVSGVFKNLDGTDVQVTNGSVTIPAMGVVVLGKN